MPQDLNVPAQVLADIRKHIARAIMHAESGFASAQEEEDSITGAVCDALRTPERIVDVTDGQPPGPWRWSIDYAKLGSKGSKEAAESVVGADAVIEIQVYGIEGVQRKSALFQAKKEGTRDARLHGQCAKMSVWREASFVVLYTSHGYFAYALDACLRARGSLAGPLNDAQRIAIERSVGITGDPESQGLIADDLGKSQSQISIDLSKGLERIDLTILSDVNGALDAVLDGFGGIVRLDEIGARFEEEWPAGVVSGTGIVRLLVRVSSGRAHLFEVDGADQPLVARPLFDRETLKAFAAEVVRLAGQWPPVEPDTARRTLAGLLPHFEGDPVALGVRLCEDVEIAETGHLFIGPIDPKQSISFVLDQTRDPVALEDLERKVRRVFGPHTPYPDADHLLSILRDLDCRVQGRMVVPGRAGSIIATPALTPDELPASHSIERSPEEVVRDMLRGAATSRGFRMLVVPPERHPEVGRSVASALGGLWVSFEDAFFADHSAEISSLERAERFVAQRDALTEAAEATLFRLLDEHGLAGNIVVLGDMFSSDFARPLTCRGASTTRRSPGVAASGF